MKTHPLLEEIKTKDSRLRAWQFPEGFIQIELSNRWTRAQNFSITCYLIDDLLIDTGFSKICDPMAQFLSDRTISAILCTHNHEDHAGNCGVLSDMHGCPVYLAHNNRQWTEGVEDLPIYRTLWFGTPFPYVSEEMPKHIRGQKKTLISVPTPGHSETHSAFFEPSGGTLFCGDLFISAGVKAVMRHENPYETIDSLRRAARLSPRQLINGHGLILEDPSKDLEEKADKIEAATETVIRLHQSGMSERAIERRVFQNRNIKDRIMEIGTGGEFCRVNFVRACIRHNPKR